MGTTSPGGHKSWSQRGQQVPCSPTGCTALENHITPGHGPTAPTWLPAMQKVSKLIASTNTASQ